MQQQQQRNSQEATQPGNINGHTIATLDEPVSETLKRDLLDVWTKLKVVLLPLDRLPRISQYYSNVSADSDHSDDGNSNEEHNDKSAEEVLSVLREWDLWGPLLVCLSLSVILSWTASKEGAEVFAAVFINVWLGSVVVTINGQLLGGTISFFQSLCVLGYCVFPLDLAAFVIAILRLIFGLSLNFLNILIVAVGFVWSTRASTVFIGQYISPEKRALAVYPVFFFYTFLSYLIIAL